MKRLLTITFAVALAICSLAGSFGAATAAPANNPYAREYVRVIAQIKQKFFYPEFITEEKWAGVERLADSITNQRQLENALVELRVRIHPDIWLFNRRASDELRAKMTPGYVGFGFSVGVLSLIGPDGLVVTKVDEASTAEDADLRVGDAIVEVDGKYVGDQLTDHFQLNFDQNKKAGDTTVLTIVRAGVRKTIAVKNDLDGMLGIDYDTKNSVVLPYIDYVRRESPAALVGLEKNDRIVSVNGTDTRQLNASAVVALLGGFLGDQVSIVVERDGHPQTIKLTRGIVPDWGLALGFSSQGGGGPINERDPRYNYTHFEVKNLDWYGGDAQSLVDDLGRELNNEPSLVLNLSRAGGNDAETAARLASHFMSEGTLIWITLPDKSSVRYFMHEGDLMKETITASGKTQETLSKSVPQFKGKLAVVVDGQTNGVATAIAHALQANKRGIVVGTETMSDAVLNGVIDVTTPDKHLVIVLPTSGLLAVDGSQFQPVKPDSFAVVNLKDAALIALSGSYWLTDPNNVVFVLTGILAAVLALWTMFTALTKKRKQANGEAPEAPVATPVEAKPEPAPAAQTEKKQANTGLSVLRICLLLAMVAGFFAMVLGLGRLAGGPPIGGHSEVLVLSIVDGSQQSDLLKTQVASVQAEIKGDVRFKTVDVREHPEYLDSNPNHVRFATSQAPMVWVLTVTYDKNGKEVSSGGGGTGGVYGYTKRELIRSIRWAAAGYNHNLVVPVERVKPDAH